MSDDDRDNDVESDADKRAHHNALERKRRDHIKDSFSSLREALPSMTGEKVVEPPVETINDQEGCGNDTTTKRRKIASRAQILKRAADYIQQMRKKNCAHQQDIDDLKRQNKILEDQIRNLEKTKSTGNFANAGVLDVSHYNTRGDAISAFDGGSGSESSDTDGSKSGRRKKMKTNQNHMSY